MSSQQSNYRVPPPLDEAYWEALFAQESLLFSPEKTQPPAERGEGALHFQDWQKAQAAYQADQLLQLRVIGYNKGGLLMEWDGLPAFVPASQLNGLPDFHIETARLRELQRRQNQTLRLKIIELDPQSNTLILSERAAHINADQRHQLLQSIQPGDRLHGCVTNLTNFGAFVDLGGVEGLIHISEISWSRVDHPSDHLQAGQEIEVLILSVDVAQGRIALSWKQLQPDPWQTVEQRYWAGQMVWGVVNKVVYFGVFVELEKGLEGLIHVSELAADSFLSPQQVIKQGDHLQARVLEVNGAARRLALSLRPTP